MKNIKFTLLLASMSTLLFSQERNATKLIAYKTTSDSVFVGSDSKRNLSFGVRGSYIRGVIKSRLNAAAKLEDLYDGYPTNWLKDYVSTEIVSASNGKKVKASGMNNALTSEQKKILSSADLGAEVLINIRYKSKNSATDKSEIRSMSLSVTVVPDNEADFKGGKVQMKKYFSETVIDKISSDHFTSLNPSMIKFTVNEDGDIINARITMSTGDQEIDRLILESVNKMPKWIPAKNSDGMKVKQDFEFVISNDGC